MTPYRGVYQMEITSPCLIAINRAENIDEEMFNHALQWIPEDHRYPIMRLRRKEDRDLALLGALLIRYAISKACSIPFKDIVIRKNEYGKPYLSGSHHIHFNISHSGQWVVLMLSEYPVGVDIEQIKDIDLTAFDLFFASCEINRLSSYTGRQKLSCFYDLWTLKESYMKAIGVGLSMPPDSFWIEFEPRIAVYPHQAEDWHFRQYAFSPEYKLSVCSSNPSFPEEVRRLASDHFMNLVSLHVFS
ncbi:4'-phosphopantetheinyl transferase family protein [Paenibacillus terrigena]|uniref:4'-phosphopantetheinyl transferase family protein n=1 Tax=Paenibacillus terrigena TaxID=369333 RepID=UPI0037C8FBCF